MAVLKKIEAVRARIRALKNERTALEAQPRSRDAVREKVVATVTAWHERARQRHARNLRQLAHGHHVSLLDLNLADDAGPTWTLMLGPEAVQRALLQDIDCVPEGVSAEARAARLEAISKELEAVEAEEEVLIVQAEVNGERVWRRGDASPAAIFGAIPAHSP
ncbi:hypothetical protein EZ313_19650 [Ramlibacter henchirensis]|uniref:Uncharacterized protein n=1 Tax=Ramlibacter henchirensis TaxID=204072 RepID=A0A4Z0BQZ8_9BURK|nr:hypothetical protein [Ramlibacter henchirensis]TFZ00668.1 hypothetical protein EZ313_19650 [Ramlibacter henchirensis]